MNDKRWGTGLVGLFSGILLMLGSALPQAEVTNLSQLVGTPKPTVFAAESLDPASTTLSVPGQAKFFNIVGPAAEIAAVDADTTADPPILGSPVIAATGMTFTPGVALDGDDDYFFRIALDGMIFRGEPNLTGWTSGSTTGPIQTATGSSQAVFQVPSGTGNVIGGTTSPTVLTMDLSDVLAVGSMGPASYTAKVTLHDNQFDALDGINVRAGNRVGGEAVIIRVVNALSVAVSAGTPATASVDTGYLWFVGATEPTNTVLLGSATVGDATQVPSTIVLDSRGGAARAVPTAAEDALFRVAQDLVAAPTASGGGVHIRVSGDLTIGAFKFVQTADECEFGDIIGASAENPVTGFESARRNPGTATGLMAGVANHLCMTVDTEGPRSNSSPIEAQTFEANVAITPKDRTTSYGDAQSASVGNGTIGVIRRDGTNATVDYLTASEKYNQRLIIINRSSKMVTYDMVSIISEDGTTVMLSDAAMAAKEAGLNTIGPRSQVVLRVGDILEFDGMNRASATVAINANPAHIGVLTTQVNLEDGSTDTVIYQ